MVYTTRHAFAALDKNGSLVDNASRLSSVVRTKSKSALFFSSSDDRCFFRSFFVTFALFSNNAASSAEKPDEGKESDPANAAPAVDEGKSGEAEDAGRKENAEKDDKPKGKDNKKRRGTSSGKRRDSASTPRRKGKKGDAKKEEKANILALSPSKPRTLDNRKTEKRKRLISSRSVEVKKDVAEELERAKSDLRDVEAILRGNRFDRPSNLRHRELVKQIGELERQQIPKEWALDDNLQW